MSKKSKRKGAIRPWLVAASKNLTFQMPTLNINGGRFGHSVFNSFLTEPLSLNRASRERACFNNREAETELFMVIRDKHNEPCMFDGDLFVMDNFEISGVPLYDLQTANMLIERSNEFRRRQGWPASAFRIVPVFHMKAYND